MLACSALLLCWDAVFGAWNTDVISLAAIWVEASSLLLSILGAALASQKGSRFAYGFGAGWVWIVALIAIAFIRNDGSLMRSEKQSACITNLRMCATAMVAYSIDFDDRLPSAGWIDATTPYLKNDSEKNWIGRCGEVKGGFGQAFDRRRVGAKVSKAHEDTTDLLFDSSDTTRNAVEGLGTFAARHGGKGNIAFLDTHARSVANVRSYQ
jgi:prepilin-type processing-associated H-X9-DG protein